MNSPASRADTNHPSRRPFDGVMVTLSAALLVIFGIVLGRFLVTTQAVQVVDRFDVKLSTLRAEIADLNRQVLHLEGRNAVLEEASDDSRKRADQQQQRADQIARSYDVLRGAVAGIAAQRHACLSELQQCVASNRSIPAVDVFHFVDALFDVHARSLANLDGLRGSQPAATQLPAFASETPGSASSGIRQQRELRSPADLQALSAGVRQTHRQGVYFSPTAQAKRKPRSYLSFAPSRGRQVAMPHRSGITFHETAAVDETTVRR